MPFELTPQKIAAAKAAGYTDAEIEAFSRSIVASPERVTDRLDTVIPEAAGGAVPGFMALEELRQMGARAGNLLMPGQPFEVPAQSTLLDERFPGLSATGQALPYMVPGPQSLGGSIAFGAGLGALSDAGPVAGAIGGGASSGIGYGLGQVAGRVANAIKGAARSIGRQARLSSGIRLTTGQAAGSQALQGVEASLARNPLTAGPFNTLDEANQGVMRRALARFLEVPDDLPIERALTVAYRRSTQAINNAVPDAAVIPVPEEFARKVSVLQQTGEGFDLPEGVKAVTGGQFKDLRSELMAGLKSTKALVRRRSREAIDILDAAAEASGAVDREMYAAGRQQYRAWKTAIAGAGISKDLSRVNPDTMLNNLKRSYGEGALFGSRSTGLAQVDDFVSTMRDAARARSPVPNSGTPTGLSVPLVLGDVAATGGLGTLSAMAGSRLSQTGAGLGAATGLMENPAATSALAAAAARAGVLTETASEKRKRKEAP